MAISSKGANTRIHQTCSLKFRYFASNLVGDDRYHMSTGADDEQRGSRLTWYMAYEKSNILPRPCLRNIMHKNSPTICPVRNWWEQYYEIENKWSTNWWVFYNCVNAKKKKNFRLIRVVDSKWTTGFFSVPHHNTKMRMRAFRTLKWS